MGYTPDLVAGVWVGNADNTPMKDVSGITGAGPIWHDFMTGSSGRAARGGVCRAGWPRPAGGLRGFRPAALCGDPAGRQPDSGHRLSPAPPGGWSGSSRAPSPLRSTGSICASWSTPAQAGRSPAGTPDARPEVIWQFGPEYQAWARENDIPQLAGSSRAVRACSRARRTRPGRRSASSAPIPAAPCASIRACRSVRSRRPSPPCPAFAADRVTLTVDGAPFAMVGGPDYTAWWPLQEGRHVFGAWATRNDGVQVVSPEVVITVER